MGKRSNFERIARDKYLTTDPGPVRRLQAHLPAGVRFVEPCAGKGDLIKAMEKFGHQCAYACDIKPQRKWIEKRDAFTLDREWRRKVHASMFCTNPPWTRAVLHEMIIHLSDLLPTWLLMDASWAFTAQAQPILRRCSKIVAVGRVRWIPNGEFMGKDDSAWYLFSRRANVRTEFHGLA